MHVSLKRLAATLALACAFFLLSSANAFATHFRYGTIMWSYPNPQDTSFVQLTITTAWRRSFFSPTPTLGPPVSVVDVGPINITNSSGTSVATPEMLATVQSLDIVDDWFVGTFTTTLHLAPGAYTVTFLGCCRNSEILDNNHDIEYQLVTTFTAGGPGVPVSSLDNPPVSSTLPIIPLAANHAFAFPLPSFDPDGDPVTFRFSTLAESGLVTQHPAGLTLSPAGLISWTPTTAGLYAMQVMVSDGKVQVPVDFMMDVEPPGALPSLTIGGASGSRTVTAFVGVPLTLTVTGTEPLGQSNGISLTSAALPPGALTTPSLPVNGIGTVSSTFTWTPPLGATAQTAFFQATDAFGAATFEPLTINIGVAQLIYVSGTLRTFASTDPDFNVPADGDNTIGLVAPSLGADSKPVFAPTGTPTTVGSAATFSQWFNKSASQVYSFTLSNAQSSDPGVFGFGAAPFYPLGNTPTTQFFTYEVHSYLQYTPGKVLQFSSSDDMWVFINGHLAVDLGGVHATPRAATLNMEAFAPVGGLTPNQVYRLDLFYAHRGGADAPSIGVQTTNTPTCDPLGAATPVDVTTMNETGSAHVVTGAPNKLRVINRTDVGPSGGTAWTPTRVGVAQGFQVDFDFQETRNVATTPAEGFAFVLQASAPTAFGGDGRNLEYAGIDHSLAIEFDSNQDTALFDPACEHIAAHSQWASQNSAVESVSSSDGPQLGISLCDANSPMTFDNGVVQHAKIVYTPAITPDGYGWIRVWINSETLPRMQAQIKASLFAQMLAGGTSAWLGFTASTAGSPTPTAADVDIFNVAVTPPAAGSAIPIGSPASMFVGDTGQFSVQAVDACGNSGVSGGAAVSASIADGPQTTPVTVADNNDGTYTMRYSPPTVGTWLLSVQLNGTQLPTSPYPVTVLTNPRVPATLTVTSGTFPFDGHGHPATVSLTGTGGVTLGDPVTVTYNGVAALPVYPGTYAVVATFAGDASYQPATATATITITGQIPAASCTTFDPPVSIPPSGLTTVGNVPIVGSTLTLSGDVDEATAAWLPYQAALWRGFSAEFDFQATPVGSPEGFAFVLQDNSLTSRAGSGGNLGYAFPHNIAVEFDMLQEPQFEDPNGNGLSVHVPNGGAEASSQNALGPTSQPSLPIRMNDGALHHAAIVYQHSVAGGGVLEVFIDHSTTPALVVPITDAVFFNQLQAGVGWVGFTSGTGSAAGPINLSSFTFTSGGNSPVASTLVAPPPALTLGTSGSVTLQMRDACGAAMATSAPGIFTTSLTLAASTTPVAMVDNGNGTYTFAYTPPTAGNWSLAIAYNGVALSSSPFTVQVSVPDTTPPVVTPPPAVITGTGPGNPGATVLISDATLGIATATDNSGGAVTIVRAGVPPGNLFPIGTTTVIYTGTDPSNNSASATQFVTVNDTTPPVVTPPAGVAAATGPGDSSGAVLVADAALGVASAADNSGTVPPVVRSGVPSGNLFPIGTTTITYAATDAANNTATAFQHVVVSDTTLPTISAPPAVTVSTTTATAAIGDDVLGSATASDNSGEVTVARAGVPAGNAFPIGTTTITYTATDPAGNTASATQLVTVTDVAPPVITTPAAVVVGTGLGNPGATVLVSDSTIGVATAADNSGAAITVSRSGVPGGNLFPLGTTTITYSASDPSGNAATAAQTVTVNDTTPPVITAPAAVTAGTNNATALVADGALGSATATDNSGGTVTLVRSGVPAGNLFPIGSTTVTYTATDAAGNTASATQQVVVTDTAAPVIAPPAAVVAFTGAGNPGPTVVVNDAAIGTATATDNSGATITVNRAGVPAGDVFSIGVATITYTATDPSGNTATATQTVTVRDNTAPIVSGPANVTTATAGAGATVTDAVLGTATTTDNSGAPVTLVRTGVPAGNLFPIGTTTVTYTATDAAGNVAVATQRVTVVDNAGPSISVPSNQSVAATSAAGAIVNYPAASATDAGSGLASVGCVPASGATFPVGTTTVTCTAKDNAGNTSTATFTVTVSAFVLPPQPDGRMFGDGALNENGVHYHFDFRASQIHLADYAKVEFWAHDPRACRNSDDDNFDDGRTGERDQDYGGVHCNPTNLLDSTVITAVNFSDDPGFSPDRNNKGRAPKPTVDTVQIIGTGRWNGKAGYTFVLNATDQGEPGKNRDTFSIVVKDARGVVVASVSGPLDSGNIQSTRLK